MDQWRNALVSGQRQRTVRSDNFAVESFCLGHDLASLRMRAHQIAVDLGGIYAQVGIFYCSHNTLGQRIRIRFIAEGAVLANVPQI